VLNSALRLNCMFWVF